MFLKLTLLFFLVSSQDSEEPTAEPTWLPPQPKLAWPTTFHVFSRIYFIILFLKNSCINLIF